MMFFMGKKNDVPHGGKEINHYVLSTNMQCIATISVEDKSIVVWTITKELIVKYDNSLNVNDLERALNADKLCKNSDYKFENLIRPSCLRGVSDCKPVILLLHLDPHEFFDDF